MLFERDIIKKIKEVIPREEFIIISGARQAGKTSILLMLKNYLEENGQACHYFNLENSRYLKLLNKNPYNIFELIPGKKTKQTLFIDEIQYLDNPTNFLKLLYDEKRGKIKIIASGSSSFYIDRKFKDSLAGRKFLFEVYPLYFGEFLIFQNEEKLLKKISGRLTLYEKEKLESHWDSYILYGGYPKVVLAENNEMKKILLEEIGTSYIKKDALDAGVRNTDKYFTLLKILAGQTGQMVNAQEISNTLNMARKTIDEYLYVIKKSYQAAFIRPYYRNIRKELTKMPKNYFYDLGLRNFFLNNFNEAHSRSDRGPYLENIAFREFLRQTGKIDDIKYWRTQDKKEIDFIIGKEAFEIKFNKNKKDEKKYAEFKKQYPDIKFSFLSQDEIMNHFYA